MKFLFYLIAVIVVALMMIYAGGFVWDAWLRPSSDSEYTVVIEPGASVYAIGKQLEEHNIVDSARGFALYVKLFGNASGVQAGTFYLREGMRYVRVADVLSDGRSQEVQITIPEGFTAAQIGARVRALMPNITEQEWTQASADAEGYLFPDTYRFAAKATASDIIDVMKHTLEKKLQPLDVSVARGGLQNLHDVLTLASIVQREGAREEDMKKIADVFLKRLELGMALQADSTVNYITGKQTPSISYSDAEIDSPYNTYKYRGLPPGPISNPGIAAVEAVLNPEQNDYYFFLTTPEGEVKYARTLQEHNANRRFLR